MGSTMLPKTTPSAMRRSTSRVQADRQARTAACKARWKIRVEPVQKRGVEGQSRVVGPQMPDETPARGVHLVGPGNCRVERLGRRRAPTGPAGPRVVASTASVDVGPEAAQVVGATGKDSPVAHDGDGECVVWSMIMTSPGSLSSGRLRGELSGCGETPG